MDGPATSRLVCGRPVLAPADAATSGGHRDERASCPGRLLSVREAARRGDTRDARGDLPRPGFVIPAVAKQSTAAIVSCSRTGMSLVRHRLERTSRRPASARRRERTGGTCSRAKQFALPHDTSRVEFAWQAVAPTCRPSIRVAPHHSGTEGMMRSRRPRLMVSIRSEVHSPRGFVNNGPVIGFPSLTEKAIRLNRETGK